MPPQRCVGSSVRENPRDPRANQAVVGLLQGCFVVWGLVGPEGSAMLLVGRED